MSSSDGLELSPKVLHLAEALKIKFAEDNNLDSDRLINDREYKEQYRNQMIEAYERSKKEDILMWCKVVLKQMQTYQPKSSALPTVFFLADLRHKFENEFFHKQHSEEFAVISIRIECNDEIRAKRGWVKSKVDLDTTETDLDDCKDFALTFRNEGGLKEISDWIETSLFTLLRTFGINP